MKRFFSEQSIVFAACLCAAAIPVRASGAVFSRDWKTPGDGLLTYDDVNRREWLDLSVTSLLQFPGANGVQRYDYAVGQLAPGGAFAGFTQAKSDDVRQLALSAGIDLTISYSVANEISVGALIDLMKPTTVIPSASSTGWLDERGTGGRIGAAFWLETEARVPKRAGLFYNYNFQSIQSGPENGLFLFRDVVPEPACLELGWSGAVIAAFTLTFRAARNQKNGVGNSRA